MTNTSKPVRRETFTSVRERGQSRPIIVELATTYVKLRLKGKRHSYTVTYDQLFSLGAKNAAEAARRERAENKRAKRERAA
jgi:hypothetical protein